MRVVLADAGLAFDGLTPRERPLGGAESAFVALAEALAALGAEVHAYAKDAREMDHLGVRWRKAGAAWPKKIDLFVANRSPRLLSARLDAKVRAFWLHNPAQFLSKPRYLWPIVTRAPTIVFAGPSHAATAPGWLPGRRVQIPLGVEAPFLETPRAPGPPPPRAIFTSNPTRGLSPLLLLWRETIRPAVPDAELHVFSGPQVYDATGPRAAAMRAALADAESSRAQGVVVRAPTAKADLARELAQARTLLYLGDPGETFCLAVAEAQAMGVPAVVRPIGAVAERVSDKRTGFVVKEHADFAAAAIRLLREDALWGAMSAEALKGRAAASWSHAAKAFADLARA
jgi:hypothetical protein